MYDSFARGFDPISLDQMNDKAAMMTRLDNKYVVPLDRLEPVSAELGEMFEMLSIGGQRLFTYETCYFDDDRRSSFHDHLRGRRNRCKVRTRSYVESGLCFVEVKLKDKRGVTVKRRIPVDPENRFQLCRAGLGHVYRSYEDHFRRPLETRLEPVILMSYRRMTLVARDGGERMTIDASLTFGHGNEQRRIPDGTLIVETKSERGNGLADRIMRRHHLRPVSACSKYCVGMAALGRVDRFNRFLPAMRKLNLLDRPSCALAA